MYASFPVQSLDRIVCHVHCVQKQQTA